MKIISATKLNQICRSIRVAKGEKFAPVKSELAAHMGMSSSSLTVRLTNPGNFRLKELAKMQEYLEQNKINMSIDDIFLTNQFTNEN